MHMQRRVDGEPVEVHISDILAYKRCRRAWFWTSPHRLNYVRRKIYGPFFLGSAVHYCMERLYRDGITPRRALGEFLKKQVANITEGMGDEGAWKQSFFWLSQISDVREQAILSRGMMDHYLRWARTYTGPFNDRELEHLLFEHSFKVKVRDFEGQVDPRFIYAGKYDGVARHKPTGKLYLMEYKTARGIDERVNLLPNDEQTSAYCLAAEEELGEPIEGVIYTIMRKRVPTIPRVLKTQRAFNPSSGQVENLLSRAKDIDTTYRVYVDAIEAHHGKDVPIRFVQEHYGEVLDRLRTEPDRYFARVVVNRTPEFLTNFRVDLYSVILEMFNPATPIYAHGGWSCSMCIFREPCIALNNGHNHQLILDSDFIKRDQTPLEKPIELYDTRSAEDTPNVV